MQLLRYLSHDAGNAGALHNVADDVGSPAVHLLQLLAEGGGGSLGQYAKQVTKAIDDTRGAASLTWQANRRKFQQTILHAA